MDPVDPWPTIAAERRAFADLLETLTPAQWATPSLCAAWTVEEVATHMMVGPTGSLWGFATAMVAARGSFAQANQVMVARRTSRPTSAVVADFREYADHRFVPPGLDWHAPLTDLFVHRLDVTVPLGIDHGRPLDAWPEALDFVVSAKAQRGFGTAGLPALGYAAPDVGWMHGNGDRVEGPAEAMALAITRRTARLDELSGPGAEALRAWATE